MKRGIPKAAIVMTLGAVCVFGMAAGGAKSTQVTFTKDVAPILLNRCVECHRPGEVAPMSLLTYQDVRPWAKSIKEKVLEHSMPPWFADPIRRVRKRSAPAAEGDRHACGLGECGRAQRR